MDTAHVPDNGQKVNPTASLRHRTGSKLMSAGLLSGAALAIVLVALFFIVNPPTHSVVGPKGPSQVPLFLGRTVDSPYETISALVVFAIGAAMLGTRAVVAFFDWMDLRPQLKKLEEESKNKSPVEP